MAMRSVVRANLLALVLPAGLLAGAYGFQYLGGLTACEMCWWQRYAHFAAVALAIAGFVLPGRRLWVALAGMAIAVAAGIGGYHAGVEYGWWQGVTECTSAVSFGGKDPLEAIMNAPLVRCDVVQWKIFGISLAGFDFLASGLGAIAVFALLARANGRETRA
ncbi:MAG TPA: disulfide bond formation protein B [Novosphingobium sp.]|nr:disulfide bond formation protein B [Novosphingobium sp.]